jgi:hypothetical protein
MNAPGKGILKVVSVLYIIFGGIFALLGVLALFLATTISAWMGGMMGGMMGGLGAMAGGLLCVVLLIPAAVYLVIGIIGARNADEPSKSTFFIVTGYILGGLSLIGLILWFSVWELIMLAMPVLFIVGGYMNRNAAQRD